MAILAQNRSSARIIEQDFSIYQVYPDDGSAHIVLTSPRKELQDVEPMHEPLESRMQPHSYVHYCEQNLNIIHHVTTLLHRIPK
jgi:hypothetical protein